MSCPRWKSILPTITLAPLVLILMNCGGGSPGSVSTVPPSTTGVVVSPLNDSLSFRVSFPSLVTTTAGRAAPTTEDGSSSIPFGTDDIRVQAQSETPSLPYSQEVILSRSNPSGTLSAIPLAAVVNIVAEARKSEQVIASATTTVTLITPSAVVLRLQPVNTVPVLQGVAPNPAGIGSQITLNGLNINTVRQVLLTSLGSNPPISVATTGNQLTVPPGSVSGPIIALNQEGVGLGVVPLTVQPASPTPTPTGSSSPTPVPTPTPSPSPSPTPAPTPTPSPSPSPTPAPTPTPSPSPSPTPTPSPTPALTTIASGLSTPIGVALSGSDFIVTEGAGKVLHITPGGTISTIVSGRGNLSGIALCPDGTYLVSEANTGRLLKIDLGGSVTVLVSSGLGKPAGIEVDAAGQFAYVVDATPNAAKVNRIDLSTDTIVSTWSNASLTNPVTLGDISIYSGPNLISGTEDFLVADANGRVLQIDEIAPSAPFVSLLNPAALSPSPVGLANDGTTLYVSDNSTSKRVLQLNPNQAGQSGQVVRAGIGGTPSDITLSGNDLIVVDTGTGTNGRLLRITFPVGAGN